MSKILVLNLGSTSFKFKLFDLGAMDHVLEPLAAGAVESIGAEQSRWKFRLPEACWDGDAICTDHQSAFLLCMDQLGKQGILGGIEDLDAVGYKAVLAGEVAGPQAVTDTLLDQMETMVPLAPAHNPVYISLMRSMRNLYPRLMQIACFETAFHATVPLYRAVYGVPKAWRAWGIRRFGFHGASHSYITQSVQAQYPKCRRVVSVHLGGSSSLCAILDGKSIFTTMGATPQSGLFQNNRVGDFDPFCLQVLEKKLGGMDAVWDALSTQSGFLGLSGISNDMRKIEAAADEGDPDAQLAINAFCDNIAGYIGMASAYMGGLDAVVFTGGIGQKSAVTRSKALSNFAYLGVKLDEEANSNNHAKISAADSFVTVLVMETNEEWMIAKQIAQQLTES